MLQWTVSQLLLYEVHKMYEKYVSCRLSSPKHLFLAIYTWLRNTFPQKLPINAPPQTLHFKDVAVCINKEHAALLAENVWDCTFFFPCGNMGRSVAYLLVLICYMINVFTWHVPETALVYSTKVKGLKLSYVFSGGTDKSIIKCC